MQKRIIIISSGHPSMDERIFWKFGLSLTGNGYEVQITTSVEELNIFKDNIRINSFDALNITKREKISRFYLNIKDFDPDLIICCEPLPILAANQFRKTKRACKIIFDITEWYPHQSYYAEYSGVKRLSKYLQYFIFNIYTTNLADHLVIGEELKAKLYKLIAPFKKKKIIGYYPPKKFFRFYPVRIKLHELNLCYCGLFTVDRGFDRVLKLTKILSSRLSMTRINLILIGEFVNENDKLKIDEFSEMKNVSIKLREWASYDSYNSKLADADVCLDLRSKTKVFNRSLPIKVFDYMASGKPVIYSNVDVLNQFPDIKNFGFLVEPDDFETSIKIIMDYLNDPDKLTQHSDNARKMFEEKYNWELYEGKFLKVIEYLIPA